MFWSLVNMLSLFVVSNLECERERLDFLVFDWILCCMKNVRWFGVVIFCVWVLGYIFVVELRLGVGLGGLIVLRWNYLVVYWELVWLVKRMCLDWKESCKKVERWDGVGLIGVMWYCGCFGRNFCIVGWFGDLVKFGVSEVGIVCMEGDNRWWIWSKVFVFVV